ncbi:MAG: hypothetical protein AAF494_05495 [Pseudomonadota bacterium]
MALSPHFARSRHFALAAAGVIGLTLVAAQPALADEPDPSEQAEEAAPAELTKGEKRLAKMLEGRVKGEPVNCIRSFRNQPLTVIDKTAYVYGRGNTIYVQRTQDPSSIDRDDVLVQRRFVPTELCRLDVVTTVDRVVGFFTGAVLFEDFVPYTRIKEDEEAS